MNLETVTARSAAHNAGVTPRGSSVLIWTMKSDAGEARCVVTVVPLGLELQYILNGSLLISRRFDRSSEVVEWAVRKQVSLHQRGWVRV
jgi:hypothetical protein